MPLPGRANCLGPNRVTEAAMREGKWQSKRPGKQPASDPASLMGSRTESRADLIAAIGQIIGQIIGASGGATRRPMSSSMAGTRSRRRSPIRRAISGGSWRRKTRCGVSPRTALRCASRRNWCGRMRSRRGSRRTRCTRDSSPRPIPCPRPASRTWTLQASCLCSTRSPIRIMSAPSCARRRPSRSPPSSRPRGIAPRRPASWPSPHQARSNWCRSSSCQILRVRSPD